MKNFIRRVLRRQSPMSIGASDEGLGSADSVVVLNDDSEAATSTSVGWFVSCVFREPRLIEHVRARLSTPVYSACRSIDDYRGALLKDFVARVLAAASKDGEEAQLDSQALRALLEHGEDVRRVRGAYRISDQNLAESGFWPDPRPQGNGRSLFSEFPFRRRHKFITKSTAICSAGSCFAAEIARELQLGGFNYLVTEPHTAGKVCKAGEQLPVSDATAAWGIIFNTPSFRQLVERAFGLRELPRILWSAKLKGDGREYYMDPFREDIIFDSPEEYLDNFDRHVAAARKALTETEVFLITLGLNEVWNFKMDGSVFSRSPWRIAPSFVEFRTLTVDENVSDLQRMLDVLREFNPNIKLIVTLSPVPLHATFLHDRYHVVEANAHSKAVLRVAAQQFVEANEGVYYFPSYELVTTSVEHEWDADQRHINRATVARVMEMFNDIYVC